MKTNNHTLQLRTLSFLSILLLSVRLLCAQTYVTPVRSDITPPTPQSAAIQAVQAPEPDLLTGAVNIGVPLYTIEEDSYSLPIALQYHTNGIKVFDDPAPLGYGWSMMPALRATRTVLGRPDEYYTFSGDPNERRDVTAACYMCVASAIAPSFEHTDRYDPEHDIFTFALPHKSITRVLYASGEQMQFIGVDDTEYLVEADKQLATITITDPLGNKFIFGSNYEYYYEDSGKLVKTAWSLDKIVTDNGRAIELAWSTVNHPFAKRSWTGGHSFMDNWDLYQWGNSGITQDSFENDKYADAVFSRINESETFLRLDKITFTGGNVKFDYLTTRYGSTLTSISVNNGSKNIRSFSLSYAGNDYTLLSSIDGGEGCKYNFTYNTNYGVCPFESWPGRHAQDWWGYFNNKPNQSLTPKIKLKTYYSTSSSTGTYKGEIGEADRSVDPNAMQALILKSVTWPTGGVSTFEYEPHSFTPTRMENSGEIDPAYDPLLSIGGGLRIKKTTTGNSANDPNALSVSYQYPLAKVRAVPSAATFVEVYNTVSPMPEVNTLSSDPVSRMRMVNIMPMSDYMRYDIGVVPIWYDCVSTILPEGKIETYHTDIIGDTYGRPTVKYGSRIPRHMQHLFNGSPVLTKQIIYKSEGSSYKPVETTEYTYQRVSGSVTPINYHIRRELVYINPNSSSAPDLVDGRTMYLSGMFALSRNVSQTDTVSLRKSGAPTKVAARSGGGEAIVEDAYSSYNYSIFPYAPRLTAKSHTVHTETGDFTTSETYTYNGLTRLISTVESVTSEGAKSTTRVTYPNASNGGVEAQMIAAHRLGYPTRETITESGAVTEAIAEYSSTASGAFRLRRTSVVLGNSSDTIYSPTCTYDRLGHLTKVVDADGIELTWTWDSKGLYPVSKSAAGQITTFEYQQLIGLSRVTTPYGASTKYDYDSQGRLTQWSLEGLGTMESYKYNIDRTNNYITSTTWLDSGRSHVISQYFDNLGRPTSVYDHSTSLTSDFIYDNMGRCCKSSIPCTESMSTQAYGMDITEYEPSPRQLVTATMKNGQQWQTQNKKERIRIITNTASGALSCPQYSIGGSGTVTLVGNYPAGTLLIEETTDEHGHVERTYKNKSGLIVMTEEGDGETDMFRTRNIYDGYNRPKYILPPSFADGNFSTSDDAFIKNCFDMEYDSRGRMTAKRNPGATAANKFVYSAAGRIMAERRASMNANDWFINFYDKLGRLVIVGTIQTSSPEVFASRFCIAEFTGNNSYAGYSLSPAPPVSLFDIYCTSYYDDYRFLSLPGAESLPNTTGTRTGLKTGSLDNTGYAKFTSMVYDNWGRVTEIHGLTPKGLMSTCAVLDRSGAPLSSTTSLSKGDNIIISHTRNTSYDNAGRPTSWSVQQGDKTAGADITYGKYGSIASETFLNSVVRTYGYDSHGWLTSVKTEYKNSLRPINLTVGQPLNTTFYETVSGTTPLLERIDHSILRTSNTETILYADGTNPRYDGTPSAHISSLGGRYDYTFDAHDRLIKAQYTENSTTESNNYSAEYSYNSVGAPLSVIRYGIIYSPNVVKKYGILDCLTYNWDGALLSSVSAEAKGTNYYGRVGYPLSAKGGDATYTWSSGGMLKTDSARGITSTVLGKSGLPVELRFEDGKKICISYNASDEVESITTYTSINNESKKISERSYYGDLTFEGDSIIYARFQGGYFDGKGEPYYMHTDWQGNISMVSSPTGMLIQHTGFYPYGEPWQEPSGQPWLFGAKERWRDNGINDYDFGARRYNSALGIWSMPDPLAIEYAAINPYVFCAANPIKYGDPSGADLVLNGSGGSSITILTGLKDYSINVSCLGINWGGNHVLEGTEVLTAALDIIGLADPTGATDLINAYFQYQSGNYIGAVTSTLSAIPGGGKIVKAFKIKNSLNIVNKTIRAGKHSATASVVAKKSAPATRSSTRATKKSSQAAETNITKVHGNSKQSQTSQHLYEIYEPETGIVYKTGISGRGLLSNGKSGRATQQVNKWNKEDGYERFDSRIVQEFPAGPGAREKALKAEKDHAYELRRAGHLPDENYHKRP